MSLNSSEQKIVKEIINKIRVKFCRNPNEIIINPNSIFYICNFIFKELNYSYEYESKYIELSQLILKNLMEYFPENISNKEKVNYFIDNLIYDFNQVLTNPSSSC